MMINPLINIAKVFSLTCLIFVSSTQVFAGRGDKAGTAGATQLLIPVGARSIALGGSSLASITGIEAIYYNPAGLTFSKYMTSAMFSHMSYLSDISVDYFAVGYNLTRIGYIGLNIKSLSFGEIAVTTEDAPDGTGQFVSPTFITIGGTLARNISDRIAVGVTSNFIYERMGNVSVSAIAFDAGVQYTGLGGIEGLNFGAAVKNVGPRLRYDGDGLFRTGRVTDILRPETKFKIEAAAADLPSTIEIGLGYSTQLSEDGRINMTSMFQNNNFSEDEYKFGAEYSYREFLFLRGGFTFASGDLIPEYIFGPSGGIGVQTNINEMNISVDYAYRHVVYFDGNHVFSIIVEF